jgi:AraC-like DNA-binding protein/mannose-6-phosphate isomerase-like protein (cupin superfamily)
MDPAFPASSARAAVRGLAGQDRVSLLPGNSSTARPSTAKSPATKASVASSAAGAAGRDSYDILAETLRSIRLTGSVFMSACFSKPFGVISPEQFAPDTPLSHLRHVSVFHLIASGSCTVEVAGERRTVSAGDILLVPFAPAHKLWNGEVAEMPLAPELARPGPIDGLWTIDHGGGGESTRMVCGFIESREFLYAPVFRSLPRLLVDRASDDKASAVLASTVRSILDLADKATPGIEPALGRLMELLFVEVVRRYAATLPPDTKNWFAACSDKVVGRALSAMHRDSARRWTVHELAREAGTSRTVLSERFAALVGQPPIEYLTTWRIQLAAERLRFGNDAHATIAADIGYESVAAFNRAFKRVTGRTPGRWREVEAATSGAVAA